MGTINSNPLDHQVNYNCTDYTGNFNFNSYTVTPLTVGDFPFMAQQGWQCPICGRVYSPTTPMCMICGNHEIRTTTTTMPYTEKEETQANTIKSNEWDPFKNDTYFDDINDKVKLNEINRRFINSRIPKTIMKELGYCYDETKSLHVNSIAFLNKMKEEKRLNELNDLLDHE